MKRFFIPALVTTSIIFTSSIAAFAQGQIQNKKVGFVYNVPPKWRVKNAPDVELKYPIAVTTPYKNFTPNIMVVDEVYSGTSEEYANWLSRTFENEFSTSRLISKSEFKTNSGILGTKLVARNTMGTMDMRQVYYLFPTKTGFMLGLTVTSPVEQGFKHDKVVDESMRKILIEK